MTASRAADAGSKAGMTSAEIPARSTNHNTLAVELRELIMMTGTTGTGKTTVSKLVAGSLGGIHIDCGKFAVREGLTVRYDRTCQSYIVDLKRLSSRIKKTIEGFDTVLILEGHLVPLIAGCLPSKVLVLRIDPGLLRHRLERRGYQPKKVAENVAAELLDVCFRDAVERFGTSRTFEVDASKKTPAQVASSISRILKGKTRKRLKHVDWIHRLENEDRLDEILTYIESNTKTSLR